jgi:hypothetical protein
MGRLPYLLSGFLGGSATTLAVDLLHFAAPGEKLFHGTGQCVALFLLGFYRGQVFFNDRLWPWSWALLPGSTSSTSSSTSSVDIIGGNQFFVVFLVSAVNSVRSSSRVPVHEFVAESFIAQLPRSTCQAKILEFPHASQTACAQRRF